jgi:hypothetical protein
MVEQFRWQKFSRLRNNDSPEVIRRTSLVRPFIPIVAFCVTQCRASDECRDMKSCRGRYVLMKNSNIGNDI